MKWVLDCLRQRDRRGFSLLYNFQKYSRFANRVRFVENAQKYPYGLEISAKCSSREPFAFYKPNATKDELDDVEAAFDHFNNLDTPIYIQLNFKGKYRHPLYMEVLEDDESPQDTDLSDEDHLEIEKVISELQSMSKSQIIDYALDKRDKDLFDKLVAN